MNSLKESEHQRAVVLWAPKTDQTAATLWFTYGNAWQGNMGNSRGPSPANSQQNKQNEKINKQINRDLSPITTKYWILSLAMPRPSKRTWSTRREHSTRQDQIAGCWDSEPRMQWAHTQTTEPQNLWDNTVTVFIFIFYC